MLIYHHTTNSQKISTQNALRRSMRTSFHNKCQSLKIFTLNTLQNLNLRLSLIAIKDHPKRTLKTLFNRY